jgi:hypothetical protein
LIVAAEDLGIAGPRMTDQPIKVDEITLSQLSKSLPAKAAWGIAGTAVALIVGAVTFGMWIQSIKDEGKAGELQRKLDDANGKVEAMIGMLNDANRKERAAAGKTEFLERYLSYINAPSAPGAKSTFVDFLPSHRRIRESDEHHQIYNSRSALAWKS